MAESNAFLAYGVTVTTESLLYAVAAWPKLQGPFAFLDLIQLRRNKDTLRAVQLPDSRRLSVIGSLPNEVWDVVRHKVVDLEFREAEVAHIKSLMCVICHGELRPQDVSWQALSDQCCDAEGSSWRDFCGFAEERRGKAARSMLATFGLAIPTPLPIRFSTGRDVPFVDLEADPRTATMICLVPPSAGGTDAFGTHAPCGGDMGPDEQVIVDVSLKVPPDATARFRRFVSQLHLQLVELTDGVLANAGSKKVQGKTKLRHDKRKCKEVPLAKIKPGWKLINMAKTTW